MVTSLKQQFAGAGGAVILPLKKADELAAKVLAVMAPYCEELEVAGSIRRRQRYVGNINIVAEAKFGQLGALRVRVQQATKTLRDDPERLIVELKNGLQIDLWFAHRFELGSFDKSQCGNFGSLLLYRTGSKQHNKFLARHAKKLGLAWDIEAGIFQAGKLIACDSERHIFEALKLPFIEPQEREP